MMGPNIIIGIFRESVRDSSNALVSAVRHIFPVGSLWGYTRGKAGMTIQITAWEHSSDAYNPIAKCVNITTGKGFNLSLETIMKCEEPKE